MLANDNGSLLGADERPVVRSMGKAEDMDTARPGRLPQSVLLPSDPPSWHNGASDEIQGHFPMFVEVRRMTDVA